MKRKESSLIPPAAPVPAAKRRGSTHTARLAASQSFRQRRLHKTAVITFQEVLPNGNEPHVGPLIDLNMMVMTGGTERTEAEYRRLLAKSGFWLERVAPTKSPFSIIEAVLA